MELERGPFSIVGRRISEVYSALVNISLTHPDGSLRQPAVTWRYFQGDAPLPGGPLTASSRTIVVSELFEEMQLTIRSLRCRFPSGGAGFRGTEGGETGRNRGYPGLFPPSPFAALTISSSQRWVT